MATTLAEALDNIELESGRTYRCRTKKFWVELRVLGPVVEPEAEGIPESEIRLDAWTELPAPSGGSLVHTQWGPPDPPDIPDLPSEEDEA
jgi:hypothetical protein